MLTKRFRTPAIVLACAVIGGVALIATDVGTALAEGNMAPIRSDLRTLLETAAILGGLLFLVVTRGDRVRADLSDHERRIEDLERTVPLARPQLRVAAG